MTCTSAILSTFLELCFVVQPPALPAGFLVEGPELRVCVTARSSDCSHVACNYLGGVIGGCFGLPAGTNHLFEVPDIPMPGEVFYVSFLDQP